MDEPILNYLKTRLGESRGTWPQISKDTGVPYSTITNIAQGKVADPRISSLQPILDYFRALDTMRQKLGEARDGRVAAAG